MIPAVGKPSALRDNDIFLSEQAPICVLYILLLLILENFISLVSLLDRNIFNFKELPQTLSKMDLVSFKDE